MSEVDKTPPQPSSNRQSAVESALRELLRLKDLKTDANALNCSGSWANVRRRGEMLEEYATKKGNAWDAARRALHMPSEGSAHETGAPLTNEQCQRVRAALEEQEWTGISNDDVRMWAGFIDTARSAVETSAPVHLDHPPGSREPPHCSTCYCGEYVPGDLGSAAQDDPHKQDCQNRLTRELGFKEPSPCTCGAEKALADHGLIAALHLLAGETQNPIHVETARRAIRVVSVIGRCGDPNCAYCASNGTGDV